MSMRVLRRRGPREKAKCPNDWDIGDYVITAVNNEQTVPYDGTYILWTSISPSYSSSLNPVFPLRGIIDLTGKYQWGWVNDGSGSKYKISEYEYASDGREFNASFILNGVTKKSQTWALDGTIQIPTGPLRNTPYAPPSAWWPEYVGPPDPPEFTAADTQYTDPFPGDPRDTLTPVGTIYPIHGWFTYYDVVNLRAGDTYNATLSSTGGYGRYSINVFSLGSSGSYVIERDGVVGLQLVDYLYDC
jgi:hypothetical protein